ncbi:septum formation family protein [Allorhizocola rhizosphaerae]|uniref:septum formation family protein n=1 Tax=Allorhizocola rhizosphaerae TaxID=1872709 RepID=UPI000E3BC94E|nr:septum formation family protein [Allorhizocola rhizosphaerae]
MRWRLGRALAAVTLVGVSGCASTNLVDAWPAMAEPTGWEPQAGVCTDAYSESSPRGSYKPLDCNASHGYETVHVGKFTGDAAALNAPPGATSPYRAAAWGECDTKATEYVGAPWRDGNVWIAVSLPSTGAWEGGARWFRCEIAVTSHELGDIKSTTKSLKGALAAGSDLLRGCYQVGKEDDAPWVPVACDQPHNTEYVGSFISNDSYDAVRDNLSAVHDKCRSLIAAYVGVPDDGNMKYRTGTYYSHPSKADWNAGDHGIRCHLWLNDKTLRSSLKGGGTKALPIN